MLDHETLQRAKEWLKNKPDPLIEKGLGAVEQAAMLKRLEEWKKGSKPLIKDEKPFIDTNDRDQLNWGGTRSSSRLLQHPFSSAPMFYRRNGMPLDLVNMYRGKSVFLINNGPSFKDVDKTLLKQPGIITFGINNGAHVFRPNLWTCVDDPSRFLKSIWDDPTITKFIPMAHFEKPIWDIKTNNFSEELVGDFPNVVGFRRNEKFDAEKWLWEDTINWGNHGDLGGGRSVMVSSLRICHLLGFKNVYLLGCDFEMSTDKKYFFEEQRSKNAINNNNNSYKIMTRYFEALNPLFKQVNFNVFNLNPKSHLKVFDFKDLREVVEKEKLDVSDTTFGMYTSRKKGKDED
jgi:hypothetical protein